MREKSFTPTILSAIAFELLLSCSPPAAPSFKAHTDPVPVGVVELTAQQWERSYEVDGRVEAASEFTLLAPYRAVVGAVNFEVGQTAHAGSTLVELNGTEPALEAAALSARVTEAQERWSSARTRAARQKALLTQNAIPREAWEDACASERIAKAQVDAARADLSRARQQAAIGRLSSPVRGVIAQRFVDPGQVVLPGHELVRVAVIDRLRIATHLSASAARDTRVGDTVTVTCPSSNLNRKAAFATIGVIADPNTGRFPATLVIDNSTLELHPGMGAVLRWSARSADLHVLVPSSALVYRDWQRVAFKVVGNRAVRVKPKLDVSFDSAMPVVSGLSAGDRVIVRGLDRVVDGIEVQPSQDSFEVDSGQPLSTERAP